MATPSPVILGFDTSGAWCGTAVWSGNDVVAAQYVDMRKGQAEALMPMIEATLDEADVSLSDLDAIGVGIGPGNFTGIRIAVSAARGLALSLGIPAIGVSLLEGLAFEQDNPVLTCLDARQDHFYLQTFGSSDNKGPDRLPREAIPDWAGPTSVVIGERGDEIAALLGAEHRPAQYAPASAIARIAARRWTEPEPRPAPMYLRAADAAPSREQAPKILSS